MGRGRGARGGQPQIPGAHSARGGALPSWRRSAPARRGSAPTSARTQRAAGLATGQASPRGDASVLLLSLGSERSAGPHGVRRGRRESARSASRSEAGQSTRTAPNLRTMGPRRLLLVAAGLSLCGPLLSARTRGRKPGESCPGIPSRPAVGSAAEAPAGGGGRWDGGTKWVQAGPSRLGVGVPLAAPSASGSSRSQTGI